VGEAGNGVAAIDRYQAFKPNLTTLDISMPDKDDIAALKEIIELDPPRA
jgi:two-component system, chemotaxis family, chemotaxis protein CheY